MAKVKHDSGSTFVSPVVPGAPTMATSDTLGPIVDAGVPTGASATSGPVGPVAVVKTPTIVVRAGSLGCATYLFAIRQRGGGPDLMLLDWTQLTYNRVWCGIGDLSASFAGVTQCSEECPDVASLRPWRHELVIRRDGEEVAFGPLVTPDVVGTSGTLNALDLAGWTTRRLLHSTLTPGAPTELTSLGIQIVQDAMMPDPSPGLTAAWGGATGVKGLPDLPALGAYSSDAIASLVQSGLCWVLRGREILFGPPGMLGPDIVCTLRDGDFTSPPDVSGDGSVQANTWAVIPQSPAGGVPIVGYSHDPVAAAEDGLLEALSTNSAVGTQADADQVASLYVAETSTALRVVQGGTLAKEAPVQIGDLVPGRLVRVNVTGCYPANQVLRLTSVGVTVTPASEQVAIQVGPTAVAPV